MHLSSTGNGSASLSLHALPLKYCTTLSLAIFSKFWWFSNRYSSSGEEEQDNSEERCPIVWAEPSTAPCDKDKGADGGSEVKQCSFDKFSSSGSLWESFRSTETWGCSWLINWTGPGMLKLSARRDRAASGGWGQCQRSVLNQSAPAG